MPSHVTHHPDSNLLQEFFEGSLAVGFSLAVSAHVDDCAVCRETLATIGESTSNDWYEEQAPDDVEDSVFADILSGITDQPVADAASLEITASEEPFEAIEIRGRTVNMPHALQQFDPAAMDWKEIGNGIFQALLNVDLTTKCELILMEPGAKVPRHTHMGQEYMLMLEGSLNDGKFDYTVADFTTSDQSVHHSQVTEQGCVCLFVTDGPLEFTEGLARLLNPINRIKFWWAGRKSPQSA